MKNGGEQKYLDKALTFNLGNKNITLGHPLKWKPEPMT